MKVLMVLVASLFVSGVVGVDTFYSCDYISNSFIDCTHFKPEKICGNNRQTYDNKCYFSQAHCKDLDIDFLHKGECSPSDFSTPPPVSGIDLVFDFFCTDLSHRDCPAELDEVCATNGVTYRNTCEYEKYRCFHQNVHVASFGSCV